MQIDFAHHLRWINIRHFRVLVSHLVDWWRQSLAGRHYAVISIFSGSCLSRRIIRETAGCQQFSPNNFHKFSYFRHLVQPENYSTKRHSTFSWNNKKKNWMSYPNTNASEYLLVQCVRIIATSDGLILQNFAFVLAEDSAQPTFLKYIRITKWFHFIQVYSFRKPRTRSSLLDAIENYAHIWRSSSWNEREAMMCRRYRNVFFENDSDWKLESYGMRSWESLQL